MKMTEIWKQARLGFQAIFIISRKTIFFQVFLLRLVIIYQQFLEDDNAGRKNSLRIFNLYFNGVALCSLTVSLSDISVDGYDFRWRAGIHVIINVKNPTS